MKLLLFLLLTLSSLSFAKDALFDLGKSKADVSFEALGTPGMLTVHGKSSDKVQGTLRFDGHSLKGTCSLILDSFDTGIGLRNDHMKNKYLEIGKYPEASITITKLALLSSMTINDTPFNGILSLHGIKKPIVGTATVSQDGFNLKLKVNFSIQIDEFGITQPSFAGITISRSVAVEVTANVPPKN